MGCLISKHKYSIEEENLESNPYNYLFESNNQSFINPIYYNKHCRDENGIVYI
jgi:hypothetical protein